jgi:PAS domain S-box-containing protein
VRVRNGAGQWRTIESWGRPRHVDGRFVGFVGTSADVTADAEAEARLRTSERRFRSVFDHQFEFSALLAPDGRVVEISASALAATGVTRDAVVGVFFWEMPWWRTLPQVQRQWRQQIADALAATIPVRGDTAFLAADGTLRFAMNVVTALRDAEGAIEWLLVEAIDYTDRKQAEDALRDADRRKDEYLATLAHELRNPLAPIRTATALLQSRGAIDPAAQRCHAIIERQVAHMARLLDDLLDISRLSRGKLVLQRAPVALQDVLDNAVETSRPLIDQHRHHLSIEGEAASLMVDGDATRLCQVFANLLNNAAKYTEPGGRILVDARLVDGMAVVRVVDTGVGLPADALERVFGLFTQVESGGPRTAGGLGIGLALARRLVEMHGGTILARSDGPGHGSEFLVRLPARPVGAEDRSQVARVEPTTVRPGRRVLVIDDNRDAADSTVLLLERHGCTAHAVYDGQSGIEEARRWRPDIVLLDLGLPDIDGLETCRQLRSLALGNQIRILAVTGWGRHDDQQRTRAAGFDGHLVKPVDPAALLPLIQGGAPARHEAGQPTSADA